MNVHCLSTHFEGGTEKGSLNWHNMKDLDDIWGIVCPTAQRLWLGQSCVIELPRCPEKWVGRALNCRRLIALSCGVIKRKDGVFTVRVRNEEKRPMSIKEGSLLGYLQK